MMETDSARELLPHHHHSIYIPCLYSNDVYVILKMKWLSSRKSLYKFNLNKRHDEGLYPCDSSYTTYMLLKKIESVCICTIYRQYSSTYRHIIYYLFIYLLYNVIYLPYTVTYFRISSINRDIFYILSYIFCISAF